MDIFIRFRTPVKPGIVEMANDTDLELALKLQAQFDEETVRDFAESETSAGIRFDNDNVALLDDDDAGANSGSFSAEGLPGLGSGSSAMDSMSIVDQRWELLDPNPDMRAMFLEFNDKYFWGRLAGVEVRWSPKMTLCAGLCCYEGRGGLCSIRLSAPLLKLRPRKDLVETLLHEMIHAYLFVTANNKDHDGHGPEFCKHMNRLNKSTGSNITIYHNFHDEVNVYRQHWWRCNGPCQKRPPYYGMVRRAMNRAPSARDPWWAEHQRTCGGSYTKVKEPEGYGVKKGTKRKKVDSEDNSETESKKRATEDTSVFPGKGYSVGGSATTSRLIPPKNTTLDKFLKKEDAKIPASSPTQRRPDQNEETEDKVNNDRRSRGSRLKALTAIFESDDSDDDADIVIVTIDKRQSENGNGVGEDSKMNAEKSIPNIHLVKDGTNSPSRNGPSTLSVPKQEHANKVDTASNSRTGTSHSNKEDHGKKQESIIDAFDRVRKRSGDCTNNDRDKLTGVCSSQMQNSSDSGPSQRNSQISRTEQSRNSSLEMVSCPACGCKVEQSRINDHLDQCLS